MSNVELTTAPRTRKPSNIEIDERPMIVIDLDPMQEAFCRYVFETPEKENIIQINRRNAIGKHIYSHIQPTDFGTYKQRETCKNPVRFALEVNGAAAAITSRFVYVDRWGEQKIRDFIDSSYDLWLKRFFEIGYNLKHEQKEIIECVLRMLNRRDKQDNYEAIKKRDYRRKRSVQDLRIKEALKHSETALNKVIY